MSNVVSGASLIVDVPTIDITSETQCGVLICVGEEASSRRCSTCKTVKHSDQFTDGKLTCATCSSKKRKYSVEYGSKQRAIKQSVAELKQIIADMRVTAAEKDGEITRLRALVDSQAALMEQQQQELQLLRIEKPGLSDRESNWDDLPCIVFGSTPMSNSKFGAGAACSAAELYAEDADEQPQAEGPRQMQLMQHLAVAMQEWDASSLNCWKLPQALEDGYQLWCAPTNAWGFTISVVLCALASTLSTFVGTDVAITGIGNEPWTVARLVALIAFFFQQG